MTPRNDDLTPDEEAILDVQEAERETDEWLAAWSDDFNSDEWVAALINQPETNK